MKNTPRIALLIVLGVFFISPPAYADGLYSGCDYTTGTFPTPTSPSLLCKTSALPNSYSLGAFEIISHVAGKHDWKVTDGASKPGSPNYCFTVTENGGDTFQSFILPVPASYPAGAQPQILGYASTDGSCSGASSGAVMGNASFPYTFQVFTFGTVVPPDTIFNSGTGSGLFNATTSLQITQFNNGGISTTTGAQYCDQNMPYDNSSIIQATLTYIPNGLCKVGVFLVVPSADSLNQFNTLASTTKARFPFSYFATVATTWTSLTASTTDNSPALSINFHNLGFGSTTPLGNFLPNETVFSTSTVKQYFPTGTFETLKALASIALILTLVGDIFFSVKRMMK